MFPARFDKQDEHGQLLDEIAFYINVTFIRNLTESDMAKMDVRCHLEQKI